MQPPLQCWHYMSMFLLWCLDSIQVSMQLLSHHVVYHSLLIRQRTVTPLAFSPPLLVIILNNYGLNLEGNYNYTTLHTNKAYITSVSNLIWIVIYCAKWESKKTSASTKWPFTDTSWVAAMAHPDSLALLRFCNHLCVSSAPSLHFLPALLKQSLQPTFVLTAILCHLWSCQVRTRNCQTSTMSSLLV